MQFLCSDRFTLERLKCLMVHGVYPQLRLPWL